MRIIERDKAFYKSMFAIALPITLQNLITSSLNMIDTLMITSLGEGSIAAVGLANQFFFFYALIAFGINSGSSIFIAQFWGKKDTDNIKKVLGLAIILCGGVGVIFTAVALFKPEYIMMFFTKEADVVRLGSDYLRIVSLSYIITGISFAFSVALRSIEQAKTPMVVSGISFVTNTVFNYLLIFGKFGFPELGIKGAAYGTLIARIVEIIFILYAIYSDKGPLAGSLKELTNWNKEFVFKYFKTTYPVIVNETFWSLGNVMYSVAYAKIGKEATAAVQIANTIQNIFLVISRGLANACTVMVGNKIGANEEKEAYSYAVKYLFIATTSGLFLGVILYLTSGFTLKAFNGLTDELFHTSKKMLDVMAIYLIAKMFNGTLIVGVLRGGGDTTFSMLLEMGSVWLVGVPLAFLGALVFKLPVYYVMAIVSLEEVVKATIGLPRVISKKWIRNVT